MAFVAAVKASEIAPGSMKKVVVEGVEILLANVGGTFYAISERCPHLGAHLSRGTIQDGIVTCPRHGSRFDVRTGQTVKGATILFLHMDVKDIRAYPVKVVGDEVRIDSSK